MEGSRIMMRIHGSKRPQFSVFDRTLWRFLQRKSNAFLLVLHNNLNVDSASKQNSQGLTKASQLFTKVQFRVENFILLVHVSNTFALILSAV